MQSNRLSFFALSQRLCLLVGLVVAGVACAQADVTVVSRTTMSGAGPMMGLGRGATGGKAAPIPQTTYYKGQNVRTESQGSIVIFNGGTGKVYLLNPARKTYSSYGQMGAMLHSMMSSVKMTTVATVRPTGATRMIAGRMAREYAYTATVDMATDLQAMRTSSGLPPRKDTLPPTRIGMIQASGSEWVTPIASLPGGGGGAMRASTTQIETLMPGMKALVSKLAAIPGVPIAARQSMTMNFAPPGTPHIEGPAGQAPAMLITTEATTIRESPLPDSLFTIPAGYKLEDPFAGMGTPAGMPRRMGTMGTIGTMGNGSATTSR